MAAQHSVQLGFVPGTGWEVPVLLLERSTVCSLSYTVLTVGPCVKGNRLLGPAWLGLWKSEMI